MNVRVLSSMVFAVAVLACLACSSNNRNRPVPELCVSFAAEDTPTPGAVTTREGAQATCEVSEVEFVATDIDDVFGFSTRITYDRDVVAFVGFETAGSVLGSDGAQVQAVVRELVAGELTVGLARNASTGIDVVGTQVLLKLLFLGGPARDSGPIELTDDCLLGSQQPPVSKTVVCSGGTFVVERL